MKPPSSAGRLTRPAEVFKQVRHIGALKKEHLLGLYLDAQNGLAHMETVSVGSLNTTRTHPREILHPAIVYLALGFILAHNHPSGIAEPSQADEIITTRLRDALALVEIRLLDHLIIGDGCCVSLAEKGLI